MDPEELARRVAALKRAGASDEHIRAYATQILQRPPSPGARFADPTFPAQTNTPGETVTAAGVSGTPLTHREALATGIENMTPLGALGLQSRVNAGVAGAGALLRGRNPLPAAKAARQVALARQKQFSKEHPLLDLGTSALGLSGGASLAKFAPAAAKALQAFRSTKVAKGARLSTRAKAALQDVPLTTALASTYGLTQGVGRAEGTPAEQLEQTNLGGVYGGILGGLAPPLVRSGAGAAKMVGALGRSVLGNAERGGTRLLVKAAERGQINTPAILQQMEALPPAVRDQARAVGHLGKEGSAIFQAGARRSPGLESVAQQELDQAHLALKDMGARIQASVGAGETSPVSAAGAEFVKNKKLPPLVQRIWNEVKDEMASNGRPISITTDVAPTGAQLVAEGPAAVERALATYPKTSQDILRSQLAGGNTQILQRTFPHQITVDRTSMEAMDLFTKRLKDAATKEGGLTGDILAKTRTNLVGQLEQEFPDWAAARAEHGQLKTQIARLTRGTRAVRVPRDQMTREIPKGGPMLPEYRFAGTPESLQPVVGGFRARGGANVLAGNPGVGKANLLADMIQQVHQAFTGPQTEAAARQLLRSGPAARAVLQQVAAGGPPGPLMGRLPPKARGLLEDLMARRSPAELGGLLGIFGGRRATP